MVTGVFFTQLKFSIYGGVFLGRWDGFCIQQSTTGIPIQKYEKRKKNEEWRMTTIR